MDTKTTISISEARKKIFDIAEKVQKPSTHYVLTKKGRPKVVLMSAEEFELWQETLEVMQDFPDLEKETKKIDRAVKTSAYKKWPSLEYVMKKHGLILKEKPKKKYEVGSKIRTRCGKRFK